MELKKIPTLLPVRLFEPNYDDRKAPDDLVNNPRRPCIASDQSVFLQVGPELTTGQNPVKIAADRFFIISPRTKTAGSKVFSRESNISSQESKAFSQESKVSS